MAHPPKVCADLCDQFRKPHRSPQSTPREVVSKILYLRQNYHFGPSKIADYLKRFHGVGIAASSVHRILGRHGMNRLPANQKHRPHATRWIRYEKPQPGHRLHMDVKFLERIPGILFVCIVLRIGRPPRSGAEVVSGRLRLRFCFF
jgi:hypothetical protein